MSSRQALEEEITCALGTDAVPHVARLLQGAPAGWEEIAASARRRPPRTVLHIYLAAPTPPATKRIRVKLDGKLPVLTLETKQLLHEDLYVAQKLESTEDPGISLEDARALMAAPGAVISAFIKNQYRVDLSFHRGAFKASLDQVIPFLPRLPLITAEPEWHIEFEGRPGWSPERFLQSDFYTRSLGPFLRPLLMSKWQLAQMGPPAAIPMPSADEMRRYLDTIASCATAARASWHALARGRPGEKRHIP
jgi:hypothetical protein